MSLLTKLGLAPTFDLRTLGVLGTADGKVELRFVGPDDGGALKITFDSELLEQDIRKYLGWSVDVVITITPKEFNNALS